MIRFNTVGLPGGSLHGRTCEAIGDLRCARELLEEMVAKRATVFALDADGRIQFNAAKPRVALRARGVVSLHASVITAAAAVNPIIGFWNRTKKSR